MQIQTIEQLIRTVPWVAEALYADPAHLRRTTQGVVQAVLMTADPQERAAEVERLLADWDAAAVARFGELVG